MVHSPIRTPLNISLNMSDTCKERNRIEFAVLNGGRRVNEDEYLSERRDEQQWKNEPM